MSKKLITILIVVVAISGGVIFGLSHDLPALESTPRMDDTGATLAAISAVVNANNQFALDVYSEFRKEEGNVFFSPYSISAALAMTYEGARGRTAEEMRKVFHFPTDNNARRAAFARIHNQINKSSGDYELRIANALWAQYNYTFLDEYVNTLKRYYGAKATNVNFQDATEEVRKTINTWIEEKTNNKIKDLFPPDSLNSDTRLVLTNAVYFKGRWVNEFDRKRTRNEDFRIGRGNTVKVPMMRREDAKFKYVWKEFLQILEMSYEGEKLSMLVLLPKDDVDLSSLEEILSLEKLNSWRNELKKRREQRVYLFIPKFTFDSKYYLNETLQRMGMPTAFSESAADFSGMDGTRKLFIQTAIHQAFVDVNEEGTEAAAATGMTVVPTSMPPTFRADHPFIFIIQDSENGNILFFGRVANPT